MKTIKFLSGAMLFVLLLGGILFLMYPTIKIMFLFEKYHWIKTVFNNHLVFCIFAIYCPFLSWILGWISFDVNRWYKEKMKNLK